MKGVLLFLIFQILQVAQASELSRLMSLYDKDQDKKITVDDRISSGATFHFDKKFSVKGAYYLSNLAQELKLSEITGKKVTEKVVFENPVDRISRSIKNRYWNGLTRKIDLTTLETVIADPKIDTERYYLYLPYGDKIAFEYYKNAQKKNVIVQRLPSEIPVGFVNSLGKKQGLLSLALKNNQGIPYVVPGGRFNEMYGWDSYFHVLGTLIDGRLDLAKGMVDNCIYQINHYGKILNANRTYYLSRSQPPFFTSMLREVYEVLPENEENKKWLAEGLRAAIKEYQTVWMGKDRLTSLGLSRYAGFDEGIPPEVEPGHFDSILAPFAKKYKLKMPELISRFNAGKIKDPELIDFFYQDRAVRESGHDTTYRWRVGGQDRASDFVTVDLNSLLYKYELDLHLLIKDHFEGKFESHTSQEFLAAANKRKALIRKYLWNLKEGLFFDYNWKLNLPSTYISATTFYPLWAGKILSNDEAKILAKNSLNKLEKAGGLVASAEESIMPFAKNKDERQWDYPYGWAPHQILAWEGLSNYGLKKEANRLIYKWLYMITKNAMDYNGTIPEKFNVVTRSHKVFADYGNVGTKFSYITMEGFGWMNASYQLGLKNLSRELKTKLKKLISPQSAFSPSKK